MMKWSLCNYFNYVVTTATDDVCIAVHDMSGKDTNHVIISAPLDKSTDVFVDTE